MPTLLASSFGNSSATIPYAARKIEPWMRILPAIVHRILIGCGSAVPARPGARRAWPASRTAPLKAMGPVALALAVHNAAGVPACEVNANSRALLGTEPHIRAEGRGECVHKCGPAAARTTR